MGVKRPRGGYTFPGGLVLVIITYCLTTTREIPEKSQEKALMARFSVSSPEVSASICHFHDETENYLVVAVFLTIFLLSVVGNLLVIVVITNVSRTILAACPRRA